MKSFFRWLGTTVEEDSGKVSVKRIGFLILLALSTFVIVHYTRKAPVNYDWMQVLPTIVTLLSAAFTLVGLAYVPTRFGKNTPDSSPTAPPTP